MARWGGGGMRENLCMETGGNEGVYILPSIGQVGGDRGGDNISGISGRCVS